MQLDLKIIKRIRWNNVIKLFGLIFLVVFCFHLFVNWLPALLNQPKDILVTNVTSSSATITWITPSPAKGKVYYSEEGMMSGPFSSWNSKIAFDDRDNQMAYEECLKKFTKDSSKKATEEFEVEVNDSICTKYEVKKVGKYYTHHVTLQNLEEYTNYNFTVGDGNWGWKASYDGFVTFAKEETVTAPRPIFGKIVDTDKNVSSDSIIYIKFFDGINNTDSMMYSAIANEQGGWYLDGSNIYDVNGLTLNLRIGDDKFEAVAQMKNYAPSNLYTWVYGTFDSAYPDIEVETELISNNVFGLAFKAFAKPIDDEYTPGINSPSGNSSINGQAVKDKEEEKRKKEEERRREREEEKRRRAEAGLEDKEDLIKERKEYEEN